MPAILAKLRSQILLQSDFCCQMCGVTPEDIDPYTGRKARLQIGHIKAKRFGGKDELSNLRTVCSTCNQGAKHVTAEKPSRIWLLSQVRRAGQDEQRAVFESLRKKFGAT
jgi:5-methylcytosine-specific restriction endonuclease McrA